MCGRSRPLAVEWYKHRGMIRFYRKHFRHAYPAGLFGLVVIGVWLRFALVAAQHTARRALVVLARIPSWHVREAVFEAEAALESQTAPSPTLPS